MFAEIQAFAFVHRLPPAVASELAGLVSRLITESATATGAGSVVLPDLDVAATFGHGDELADAGEAQVRAIPARYQDEGPIGVGGMGEVRRVFDRELGRTCAYKAIRADLAGRSTAVARFVEEAQIGAQLQHPNIPPVYEAGRLPDGRPWFTMKEVRGRTFGELIGEVHAAGVTDVTLRRLVDVLAKVCDAVGYAHGRGVVHRDLKPDNVMVGSHGEVFVLDWGLAKVVGRAERPWEEPEVATRRSGEGGMRTRVGGVLGTAAYMPPEQARGDVERLDGRSDAWALGAMLYEVLTGRPPYDGTDAPAVLRQVLAGPPAALEAMRPEELATLCRWCLSRDPADRPADGGVVATELRAWLDGAGRRAKALEVVSQADAFVEQAASLRERAALLREEGAALLAEVKSWQPEQDKAAGWAKRDEADAAEYEAVLVELRREALLRGALTHAPELPEAHAALVAIELERHRVEEATRDTLRAVRAERRLVEHVEALPESHPMRVRAAAHLKGDGALTLHTDVAGADVELFRYERHNRRLVAVPVGPLGRTPLVQVPIAMGSYLCVIRHPDHRSVAYPVSLGRGEHWDGVPPGETASVPVCLPRPGELGDDDCLVPAGWFWSGGDPGAADGLPQRRLWCHDLVVRRFPVTNREYVAFLDDLVARGREADALRHQPRERSAGEGAPIYGRDDAGRFVLRPDADGDVWDPDWPVALVDWFGARAYAAWLAERTGRPWRLPGDLEWEKAARGVDGRPYPWGDAFDPSWACVRGSLAGRLLPQRVDSFPVDTSVYGVRGLGGNVEDWCAEVFRREGPPVEGLRVVPPSSDADGSTNALRVHRGGAWSGAAALAKVAHRDRFEPNGRSEGLGFRVAYTRDLVTGSGARAATPAPAPARA